MTNFTNTRVKVEHQTNGSYTTDVVDSNGNWTRTMYNPSIEVGGVQQYNVTSVNNQINRENTLTENDSLISFEPSNDQHCHSHRTLGQEEMDKLMEKYKDHNVIVALFLIMFDVFVGMFSAIFSLFTTKVK